jgi:hypothetical protein
LNDFEWRRDFEILSLPLELLVKHGEEAFEFAKARIERHPAKLMKQVVVVLCGFAREETYWSRVLALKETLANP